MPAGTKVLLQLRSSVNTHSAKPGDGVYLASSFPVVVGNRVMIPSGVYVQGVVDRVERAGHVKGHAQLDMHFTSIIFPNGSVVEIPGLVESLPGPETTVKDDGEGTIEQDSDKTRNMGKVAAVAIRPAPPSAPSEAESPRGRGPLRNRGGTRHAGLCRSSPAAPTSILNWNPDRDDLQRPLVLGKPTSPVSFPPPISFLLPISPNLLKTQSRP